VKKAALSLIALGALVVFLPDRTLDPWQLLNLRKISSILFTLALIQIIGITIAKHLGARATTVMTGFLGGLVSSTVVTIALSRKSHQHVHGQISSETIGFLAATAAMLIEGLTFVILNGHASLTSISPLFLFPILAACALILFHSRTRRQPSIHLPIASFRLKPTLELGLFIVVILAISKLLLHSFGTTGLLLQTFITSLFEVHGPIIANMQLHNVGTISQETFVLLIAISLGASFISKLVLASLLGTVQFKTRILKCTLALTGSLFAGWTIISAFK